MAQFSSRVKELRERTGFSQAKLAQELGMSQATIAGYESGTRTAPHNQLQQLADYFHVSVDYILGRDLPKNALPIGEFVKIPVLGSVVAGMGGSLQEDFIGYEIADKADINGHLASEYFYLNVKGDSMSPQILEGDLVLVHKRKSVDSGKVAVVSIDNEEAVIKKVTYGKNYIELFSFNPYYPVRRFESADVLRVQVIGLVKTQRRKW